MTSSASDPSPTSAPPCEVVRTYLELASPEALRPADALGAPDVRVAPREP